jgi:hypothetical protein
MSGVSWLLQRKRRTLVRYGAVALVGIAIIAVALPRAGAHSPDQQAVATASPAAMLFSPDRVSGKAFAVFYNVPHS